MKKLPRIKCPICKLEIIETKYLHHYNTCRSIELLKLHGISNVDKQECKWCKKLFPNFSKKSFRFHQRSCKQNPTRVIIAKFGSHRPSKYRAINKSKYMIEFYRKYKDKLKEYDNYYAQIKSADKSETIEIIFDENM